MSRKFLVPILLPQDPTAALEAVTKQYVDARAGSEVEIGTDDPIGANASAELWYDTDAIGATPQDARWNSSWGVVGLVGSSDVSIATGTATTIRTLSLLLNEGRRYRFQTLNGGSYSQSPAAAGDTLQIDLWMDGVLVTRWSMTVDFVNGYFHPGPLEVLIGATTGTHTLELKAWRGAGTGTYQCRFNMIVEDVGPLALATPIANPDPRVGASRRTTVALPASTFTTLTWATTDADSGGVVLNSSTCSVPAQRDGVWACTIQVDANAASNGSYLAITMNGIRSDFPSAGGGKFCGTVVQPMAAGSTCFAQIWNGPNGTLTPISSYFYFHRVSA